MLSESFSQILVRWLGPTRRSAANNSVLHGVHIFPSATNLWITLSDQSKLSSINLDVDDASHYACRGCSQAECVYIELLLPRIRLSSDSLRYSSWIGTKEPLATIHPGISPWLAMFPSVLNQSYLIGYNLCSSTKQPSQPHLPWIIGY